VTVLPAGAAARRSPRGLGCVISLSPGIGAHLVAYGLQRRGVPWLADLDRGFDERPRNGRAADARTRVLRRLVLTADVITCESDGTRQHLYARLGASPALVPNDDETVGAIDRQVRAVLRCSEGNRLRILMIGPVNSPHLEHLALSMAQRGHVVRAGGAVWGGGLPPSSLPDAGVPVSPMTWPQPLWVRRLVRSFRPDVVHANWMPFAGVAALARARPLVAMAWGSDVYRTGRIGELANRFALLRADVAMADSTALLERLAQLGARRDRLALLNWGVDLDTFKPLASDDDRRALKASLGLRDGPVVISPRGFKSLYNPEVVLGAFERVLEQLPEAQLVLKHNSDQPPELGHLSGSAQVHVVGRVPYEQMAQYFQAADVCVSIPDTDSSPRSVWEAMACGCACVLSDLPWVGELIEADRHALVVPTDRDAVAAAISRLLTDSKLWHSLTDEARKLIDEHRDADREMGRLEDLYARLAGAPDHGAPAATASSSTAASSAASWRRE
jgi:glycosyltransferase involved in cell wall biosynthesis